MVGISFEVPLIGLNIWKHLAVRISPSHCSDWVLWVFFLLRLEVDWVNGLEDPSALVAVKEKKKKTKLEGKKKLRMNKVSCNTLELKWNLQKNDIYSFYL